MQRMQRNLQNGAGGFQLSPHIGEKSTSAITQGEGAGDSPRLFSATAVTVGGGGVGGGAFVMPACTHGLSHLWPCPYPGNGLPF